LVTYDLAVIGAGPAGATAALAALQARPGLSVVLLDRADFPRDKACGDGVAPHVIDVLAGLGCPDVVSDRVPVSRLHLQRGSLTVTRSMHRPAWVVPRSVFDVRLVEAAQEAGAMLRRHRVRSLRVGTDSVSLDGALAAKTVIGADGAHSVVRRTLGLRQPRMALALRGYAPTPSHRRAEQVIVFSGSRRPSYAWSFDRGDGFANIGYGELLARRGTAPSRARLTARLESLLPGATVNATDWRGHHLPLSDVVWRHPPGRVLLAGDAAGLVNPLTGEGIYYAVATGSLAGRAAADAVALDDAAAAGERYRRQTRALLARHLRHTALASRLITRSGVLDAGFRAAARDQQVFDDLVEIGLGRGLLTPALLRGLVRARVDGAPL
jgi:menaquinone-9 beta-reductase